MFGRRVMICQPTTGRTKEEILEEVASLLKIYPPYKEILQ